MEQSQISFFDGNFNYTKTELVLLSSHFSSNHTLWLSGIPPTSYSCNIGSIPSDYKLVNRFHLSSCKHPNEQSDHSTNRLRWGRLKSFVSSQKQNMPPPTYIWRTGAILFCVFLVGNILNIVRYMAGNDSYIRTRPQPREENTLTQQSVWNAMAKLIRLPYLWSLRSPTFGYGYGTRRIKHTYTILGTRKGLLTLCDTEVEGRRQAQLRTGFILLFPIQRFKFIKKICLALFVFETTSASLQKALIKRSRSLEPCCFRTQTRPVYEFKLSHFSSHTHWLNRLILISNSEPRCWKLFALNEY